VSGAGSPAIPQLYSDFSGNEVVPGIVGGCCMAKTKKQQRTRRPSSSVPAKVQKGIDRIRAFYEIGKRSFGARSVSTLGKKETEREATELGMNLDILEKARAFANFEKGGYTEDEVDQLCILCVEHGHPLGPTFVHKFLTIPKARGRRRSFERETIAKGWTLVRVNVELRKRFGNRRFGGRRRRIPTERDDVLEQIVEEAKKWGRWHNSLTKGIAESAQGHQGPGPLPPVVGNLVEGITEIMLELQHAATREMKRTMTTKRKKTQRRRVGG